MSPAIRQMFISQPDSRTEQERGNIHLQSNSDSRKTFVWRDRSTFTMKTMVNNRFTQHKSTRETVLNKSKHTHMRQKETIRGKERQKQGEIHRACGQKPPCQRWYLFWTLFFQFGCMNYSWSRSV